MIRVRLSLKSRRRPILTSLILLIPALGTLDAFRHNMSCAFAIVTKFLLFTIPGNMTKLFAFITWAGLSLVEKRVVSFVELDA